MPSPELQEVHLSVLHGEPASWPPRLPRTGGAPIWPRLTSFVGRERELERVGELLREHRLLTLVGAGGAGKTRLASEVADRAAARCADGVWLVELAPVAEADGIAPAVIGSLGLREVQLLRHGLDTDERDDRSRDALDHLLEVLADKETLLVLDNCEHLLEPVAHWWTACSGACARLRIMCTSREPLGIIGEMIVPVAPLELPEDRCRRSRPSPSRRCGCSPTARRAQRPGSRSTRTPSGR